MELAESFVRSRSRSHVLSRRNKTGTCGILLNPSGSKVRNKQASNCRLMDERGLGFRRLHLRLSSLTSGFTAYCTVLANDEALRLLLAHLSNPIPFNACRATWSGADSYLRRCIISSLGLQTSDRPSSAFGHRCPICTLWKLPSYGGEQSRDCDCHGWSSATFALILLRSHLRPHPCPPLHPR